MGESKLEVWAAVHDGDVLAVSVLSDDGWEGWPTTPGGWAEPVSGATSAQALAVWGPESAWGSELVRLTPQPDAGEADNLSCALANRDDALAMLATAQGEAERLRGEVARLEGERDAALLRLHQAELRELSARAEAHEFGTGYDRRGEAIAELERKLRDIRAVWMRVKLDVSVPTTLFREIAVILDRDPQPSDAGGQLAEAQRTIARFREVDPLYPDRSGDLNCISCNEWSTTRDSFVHDDACPWFPSAESEPQTGGEGERGVCVVCAGVKASPHVLPYLCPTHEAEFLAWQVKERAGGEGGEGKS